MKIKYQDKILEINKNETIKEAFKEEIEKSRYQIMLAVYNNRYVSLDKKIDVDGEIKLIDMTTKEGIRVYKRTLIFMLAKVLREMYPDNETAVNYQLTNAIYCDLGKIRVTDELVKKINNKMKDLIKRSVPITEIIMTREEAAEFFERENTLRGKVQYELETNQEIHMNYCEDYFNYCYGILATNTSAIKLFEVIKYKGGILLRYPGKENPEEMPVVIQNKKIKWALHEYNDIHRILHINTVYRLNYAVEEDKIKDIIMLDEALHEKKIANIADQIARDRKIKMILIAGPSSSGKTTFAQRLGIQLRINKIKPVTISVDNYFVERKDNPKDENGKYNFECIEAIDLELFNDHLTRLLNGEEVEMPQFDFIEGTKKYNGNKIKLHEDEVLVIEGIHCLNDRLTSKIPQEQKFKIYISALKVLNMDRYTKISAADIRLIRRIVRDYQFRGYSAKRTIESWPSVGKGEVENIFPFQESADAIFNTSLIYELGVLKNVAKPVLEEIKQDEPEFAEAQRLLEMLKYIREIPPEYVPTNSLLKEFMGGGNFKY